MFKDKNIFFAALDWGMGHTTRSLPLLRDLTVSNHVILGVSPTQIAFYRHHFPHLEQIILPSYNIRYSLFFPAWFRILLSAPSVFKTIRKEQKLIRDLIALRGINLLLSDNRYGLFSENVQSIIICHQLTLKAPFFETLTNHFHRRLLSRFHAIWVPDHEPPATRLAGELSRSKDDLPPVKYIGPLSALSQFDVMPGNKIDYLLLLSGPEPCRTEFEDLLLNAFKKSNKKIVLVRGTGSAVKNTPCHITIHNLLFGEELARLILNAEKIVCRSGYSTLMDLYLLKKSQVILVPTPGQTEQEYLARYWERTFNAIRLEQNKIGEYRFD